MGRLDELHKIEVEGNRESLRQDDVIAFCVFLFSVFLWYLCNAVITETIFKFSNSISQKPVFQLSKQATVNEI
ncbi:MAG: hypothetical protein LBK06_00690 [Planctomycetaceae bacterium]|nr:hypothetical protein [Planctomycetaceae bacterium]